MKEKLKWLNVKDAAGRENVPNAAEAADKDFYRAAQNAAVRATAQFAGEKEKANRIWKFKSVGK